MPVWGAGASGEDVAAAEADEEVPDARRADQVEGTSRPRGDTHPMPVTTTLRKGGASFCADMALGSIVVLGSASYSAVSVVHHVFVVFG